MSAGDTARANRNLRLAHRAALGALAACALWAATLPAAPDAPGMTPPDMRFTLAAIGLAMGAILCRQRAAGSRSSTTRYRFSLARFAFAAAMGPLALILASVEADRQVPLVYCLAAAILSLRPAEPVAFDGDETAT